MKIVFFWTGEFSQSILRWLTQSPDVEVVLVVSQPDKPVGRKKEILPTPVKQFAWEKGIPVLQPLTLKDNSEFELALKQCHADFFVVVAYGKIIPMSILEIPKYYPINVHGSILPKYRGASPIQEAVKNGETQTWISIMEMTQGMDEGWVFDVFCVPIERNETSMDIFEKFSQQSTPVLLNVLQRILNEGLTPVPQDDTNATYCKKISKEDGKIDFELQTGESIYNTYRAYTPWPGIYSYYHGKKFDIIKAHFEKNDLCYFDDDFQLGDVVEYEDHGENHIAILCKWGLLVLEEVKLEGKKQMDINSFVRGNGDFLEYNFLTQ